MRRVTLHAPRCPFWRIRSVLFYWEARAFPDRSSPQIPRSKASLYGSRKRILTPGSWIFCTEVVPGLEQENVRHLLLSSSFFFFFFSSSSFFFFFFFSTPAADDLSSCCLWIMSSLRDKEDNLLSMQHKEVLESSKHQRVHKSLRWDSETGGRSTEPLMTPAVMELKHGAPHGAYDTLWWAIWWERVITDIHYGARAIDGGRVIISQSSVSYVLYSEEHGKKGFTCIKIIIQHSIDVNRYMHHIQCCGWFQNK